MKMTDPPSGTNELLHIFDSVPTESTHETPPISSNQPAYPISMVSKDPELFSQATPAPFQPEVDMSSESNIVRVVYQRDAKAPTSLSKLSVSNQERHVDPMSRAKSTSPFVSPESNSTHEQSLPPKAQEYAPISPVERTPSSGPLLPDSSPIFSPPPSPSKHIRIPSTGNRPTVMQVAQDFLNPPTNKLHADPIISEPEPVKPPESPLKPRATLSQMQAEKRKSSYEKYSAMVLPPLKEEATPTPSPAGTLTRINVRLDVLPNYQEKQSKSVEIPMTKEPGVLPRSPVFSEKPKAPFPEVNISKLLNSPPKLSEQRPADILTISVEVLAITGTTATPLSRNLDIFYDSEILAIVHRTKSKSTGLASTTVWCWLGRRSLLGDREERKIHDLSKRYGTSAVSELNVSNFSLSDHMFRKSFIIWLSLQHSFRPWVVV